jgi:hypothetical protein
MMCRTYRLIACVLSLGPFWNRRLANFIAIAGDLKDMCAKLTSVCFVEDGECEAWDEALLAHVHPGRNINPLLLYRLALVCPQLDRIYELFRCVHTPSRRACVLELPCGRVTRLEELELVRERESGTASHRLFTRRRQVRSDTVPHQKSKPIGSWAHPPRQSYKA